MGAADLSVSDADLDLLDAYLLSDQSPPECMLLSDLDGFLTGIAIGPEVVMPSEWLPHVWGGEEPVFDDPAQASAILGTIMGRYRPAARARTGVLACWGKGKQTTSQRQANRLGWRVWPLLGRRCRALAWGHKGP